jgi:hypothetical protein
MCMCAISRTSAPARGERDLAWGWGLGELEGPPRLIRWSVSALTQLTNGGPISPRSSGRVAPRSRPAHSKMALKDQREPVASLDPSSVEAIANRIVELLDGGRQDGQLIDAAEVARRYGISRSTVYERAADLGAIRLGNGPRARLRFDAELVAERLRGDVNGARPKDRPELAAGRRRRRKGGRSAKVGVELLPIRAQAAMSPSARGRGIGPAIR